MVINVSRRGLANFGKWRNSISSSGFAPVYGFYSRGAVYACVGSFRERRFRNFSQLRAPRWNLPRRRSFLPGLVIRRCYLVFLAEILFFLGVLLFRDVVFRFPRFFFRFSPLFYRFCLFASRFAPSCCVVLFSLLPVFFFVLISFFSVFGFRGISIFSSGIRGPLERGRGMAGTGGPVKRPNFDNASFAEAALPKTIQKMRI